MHKSYYEQFEIPNCWKWIRLGDISYVGSSKRVFTTEFVDDGIPFYRGTEISALAENKTIKQKYFISENHYRNLIKESGLPSIGDILLPSICPDGQIWSVNTNLPFYFKDGRVLWVHFETDRFDKKYIYLALKAMLIRSFRDLASGSTFAEMKIFVLKEIDIPLPPFSEQRRIVAAIESAFAVIDEIEKAKGDLQNAVAAAKRKVLSLAIRGKLGPQDPNDEPASALLKRIRFEREELIKAGKIKRDKSNSVAFRDDDNSYYGKLPDRWSIIPIEKLFSVVGGGTPSISVSEYWGEGIPWFSSADIDEGGNITPRRCVTPTGIEHSTTNLVPSGSVVVVTRVGLGKVAVLNTVMCFSQDIQALIPIYPEVINSRFLFYFLLHEMQTLKLSGRGTTISGITKKQLADVNLWLPPIAEQRRIVAALEATYAQFDEIAENLS